MAYLLGAGKVIIGIIILVALILVAVLFFDGNNYGNPGGYS